MSATAHMEHERWRTMTPPEATCGRCDKSPSGRGARTAVDPERGLIVACAECLPAIARAAEAARRRARRNHG